MLLKLQGFQWATSLDLNMGYYYIRLDPALRALCTLLVLPWGKYEMQGLPIGLLNNPNILQEKMSKLMIGLEFVQTYIDDLLVISNGTFEDHLNKLDEVLKQIKNAGLKINATKSFFCQAELEYLGYWITREAIMPIPKKNNAMLNIDAPKHLKELRSFIGLVNYYRDMCIRQSDVLEQITKLISKDVKWQWAEVEAKAFSDIKRILADKVLLLHPNFTKEFDIHTNASDYQLGAVILQENKPIAFYSRKLHTSQRTQKKNSLLSWKHLKSSKTFL